MYVDKRLAGIQAVQTLSRLNRAYPGKDTTYVLDFVNNAEDVLAAFKTYHTTAELADVTDPNLVYNLRAKLDAAGHYDDFEVDRVVAVELNPNAKQSELAAAVEPVVDRLPKKYKAAQEALKLANETKDKPAAETVQNELNALLLFQRDMGAFQRLYTYLSQIFDYGNTAIEKRSIFYKQVLRLLEFGREREGIDLSKVKLTHHTLKNHGKRPMPLGEGEYPKLEPITEAGGDAAAAAAYDKLLLVLSKPSMKSEWVKTEIRLARRREIKERKRILFPISLVPFTAIKKWSAFDAEVGKDTAVEIREYLIPDFSNWKDDEVFEAGFQRLLKDLKADAKREGEEGNAK